MKVLERAIRVALEADSIGTVFTVTQNESFELIDGGTNSELDLIRYRTSVQSQISTSSLNATTTILEEEENNYDIISKTQKKVDDLKSDQVYWIKEELDRWYVFLNTFPLEWYMLHLNIYFEIFLMLCYLYLHNRFDRKQGITELTSTLINGKEANWDEDDPLPFTAAHLLQLPDLIRNTISPEQNTENKKIK